MVSVENPLGPIDALGVFEGSFKWFQLAQPSPDINLKVAYISKSGNETYGSCDLKAQILSVETIKAFEEAIQLAEQDFAKILFGGSERETSGEPQAPGSESGKGLVGRGLGQ